MDFWFQLIGTVLLASIILLIFFKLSNSSNKPGNSLDSNRKGSTVLITGAPKSGKTFLYQQLVEAPRTLKTVHSLKPNIFTLSRWKIIDLPMDSQKLHSQPADFFHYNELAALIHCITSLESDLEFVTIMTFSVGVLKNVPLCINILEQSKDLDKEILLSKLLRSFNTLQQDRLSALLSADSSNLITFDDPINRLIFETPEGEVSAEYESRLREYFNDNVTLINNNNNNNNENGGVRKWLDQQTL